MNGARRIDWIALALVPAIALAALPFVQSLPTWVKTAGIASWAQPQIDAVSGFDGGQTASNTDQVTVSTNAVVNVTKAISAGNGASPSGPYTYTLSYTNSGNAGATQLVLFDAVPAGMTYVPGSARWSMKEANASAV